MYNVAAVTKGFKRGARNSEVSNEYSERGERGQVVDRARRVGSDVRRIQSRGNSVAIHYFPLWPHAAPERRDGREMARRRPAELGKTARVRLPSSNLPRPCFAASFQETKRRSPERA